jgi:dTMP kinase
MALEDTCPALKKFIVFEGIDGSGTTTQLKRLASRLQAAGVPAFATAEPTARPEGQLIRRILKGELHADPGTVAFLFAADRHEHLHGAEGILQRLQQGQVVICDRYVLSSLAYQGFTCGAWLPSHLNAFFPPPGLSFFFRIDPESAMRRVAQREELEIYEVTEMQRRFAAEYERQVEEKRAAGWRIEIIDANKSIAEIGETIFSLCIAYLAQVRD